jgi:hypothetical protein
MDVGRGIDNGELHGEYCDRRWELQQCVNLLIMKIIYFDIQSHFMPVTHLGSLTLALSLEVTPRKILNLFFSKQLTHSF